MARRRGASDKPRGEPVLFVVVYTVGLLLVLAASGFVAVQLGVNPAWIVLAASLVVLFGAVAVHRAARSHKTALAPEDRLR